MALKIWEPYVRQVFQSLLVPSSVFIDVGAHIGYYTVLASKTVGPNGLVIAIEPDERNGTVLLKNCTHLENVLVYQAAAGLYEEYIYLKCTQNPLFNRLANQDETPGPACKRVACITLDSLIPLVMGKNPSSVLLKVDVEGAEIEVLQGGVKFVRIVHPALVIETAHASEIEELLKPFGYTSRQLFDIYWLFT